MLEIILNPALWIGVILFGGAAFGALAIWVALAEAPSVRRGHE